MEGLNVFTNDSDFRRTWEWHIIQFNVVIPLVWDSKKLAKANTMTPLKSRTQTRSRSADGKTIPNQTGKLEAHESFKPLTESEKTESEKESGWKGPQWNIWSNLPSQLDYPTAPGREMYLDGSWILLVRETLNLSWQSSLVSGQLHIVDLPHTQIKLSVHQLLHIISCPIPQHHWEQSGSIFLAPPLQILAYIDDVSSQLCFPG